MVDIDIFLDIGEYFFNLYYSFLLEIEGVFCFNNLINFLLGLVSFGFFFLCCICGVYVFFWRYCFYILWIVLICILNFFVIWEKNFL